MSLRYIFGGAGVGKSSFILNDILNQKFNDPKKLILIVPEQFSLESEKKLLDLSGRGCIIEPQVLGFNRLAYYVFSKTGKPRGVYLDDIGKVMLLRKIIISLSGKLGYYGSVSGKQGFIEGLALTVSEFWQYGITVEALEGRLAMLDPYSGMFAKLQDLILILKNYSSYLESNFVSTEEMLDILADRIYRTDILDNCLIWIDSFNGFTPQELKVIGALMYKAERVTIALLNDSDKISYPNNELHEFNDHYYEIKKTINKISRLAYAIQAQKIKIEPPVFLSNPGRSANFPELDFIRKNFFNRSGSVYARKSKNICITHTANRFTEITYVAEKIIELLRDNNYRYSDIGILTGSLADYEKTIRSVFRKHGIPVFIDNVVDVLSHPLTELVRAAIDIPITGRSYESVFRFLKTGLIKPLMNSAKYTSFTLEEKDDIDYLENYVLAYGISGYKWDLDVSSGLRQFDRDRIVRCKNAFLSAIEPIMRIIKTNSEYTVKEITNQIYELLSSLDVPGTLTVWSDNMSRAGNNEMSRRHSQIWKKVCAVLDAMTDILGDERVSLKQYAKILDTGLCSMDMGVIPPSLEQVLAGDIERSRLPEIKALFLIGLNDGVLPRIPENNSLLSDDDRIALISEGIELAPDGRRKSFNENMLIYIALCKPNEKLFLSYAARNPDGKSMRPSSLIYKLTHMIPSLKESDMDLKPQISTPEAMFTQTVETVFSAKKMTRTDKTVHDWFSAHKRYGEKLNRISANCTENKRNFKLSTESVEKLYGGMITTSVSRLETYMQCPFAYFLRYNIGARERSVYEARPVDIGSLFHLILELFTKKIESIGWRGLNEAIIDSLVNECIEEGLVNYDVFLSTSRYRYILKRVSRIIKKSVYALAEHIKNGSFEVIATELDFKCEYAERRLAITGRIDRIDLMEIDGRKYVKIIDYKSGGKKFYIKDIYTGEQLQLITYLDVVMKNGLSVLGNEKIPVECQPGGIFYFGIDDPIVNYDPSIDPVKLAYEKYKMSGLVLADSDVVIGMDRTIEKKSDIIPVEINNTRFSARSSVATAEEFDLLRAAANTNIDKIASQILNGNIDITPVGHTACDYCVYSSICRMEK